MGIKFFLLCVAILNATAVSGCPIGQEFITAVMPNYVGNDGVAKLSITAQTSLATVTVEIKGLQYKQSLNIEKGSTTYVTLPNKAEVSENGVSDKTVLITSNTDISVVSSHIKPFSGDSSVIFPSHQLGRRHVVYTPEGGPLNKVVAIVNGKGDNTITLLPYADLQLKNNIHLQRGVKMSIRLAPYQVYLLRSEKTLTGTMIESQLPVAVLAGHECLSIVYTCEHVYEQLVPVELLSDEYLVPAMHPLLINQDTAHVIASEDNTDVTVFHGPIPQHKSLRSGELLNVFINLPTVIRSNKKIMVMYSSSNLPFDEFLTNIIPVSRMSNSWTVYAQDSYLNFAVVVSEMQPSISLLNLLVPVFAANRKYTWSIRALGSQKGPITISNKLPQAVYVFGGKERHGYATTGVCSAPSPPLPPVDPCASVKCRWREECKKGVCVRVDTATCWALGDPHYKTFDGNAYDFQGTCTYTMTTTVKTEKGLVPFTILAKNNNRGSNVVAYVRTVSLSVYNHTIVASKQTGVVEVNGEITYLPVRLAGGKIEVVRSGWNALITTDFGLEVKYDWNMMLYITVPSTYFGSLGGLCGNYNGDRTDELSDPKGVKLSTVLEFAKSWKVSDNDFFCHDDCAGKCLLCPSDLKVKYSENNYCGLMAKTDGPFAQCHKIVDPRIYIDNCVYDVCIYRGIRSFLCDNMRTYAEACMAAEVKIDPNWRTLSECPLPCPVNSHYEACGTACAASCVDRDAPSKCEMPCVEGCQCNNGFVLSGDKCVPLAQCGCSYENRYYPPAEVFWGDQTCTKKCSCNSGQVKCTPTKCKTSEVCKIQNGVRDCYPLSYGHCAGSGDPHYLTFDGRRFDFQGTCTYYLSKLVSTSDPSLVPFEVLVKNENRGMNKVVSFTKTVEINIFDYTIIMSKDSYGKVMVNNLFVNLPFEKGGGQLSIFRSGYFGVVKTDFGMNVRFNWDSYVEITLPSTYNSLVGGLCGNWNGNLNDDLAFPNKSITTNANAFGNSWKARNDPDCSADCKGQKCPKCDAVDRNKDVFTKPCSLITDANGPFKACHSQISPTKFYEDCVYDMCMYGGHSTALCSALTAYTAACQTAHRIVEKWRTNNFCPASCKPNSHYDVCAAGCPQTCNGLTEPAACQRAPCIEGCVCDVGFVLSNGECVPMERCGCAYEGQYYKLGQVFYPKGKCSQRCVCEEQGKVTCKDNFSCGPNEQCVIRDGVQACHPSGKGSCSVSGSGNYHSYDGNHIRVPGNCVYKLVETVQTAIQTKMPFSVTVQQVSSAIVITRRINIVIAQYKIALIPGLLWEIRVDEFKAILPVTLERGLVKVYQSGAFIILETSFGLKVTYDTVSVATVEIPSTYKNAVRGLCGNYNDNKADDLLMPNGNLTSSAEKFVEAWRVIQEGVNCHTGCRPGPTCPGPGPEDNDCRILTLVKGPLSNCHSKVPPLPFYNACVKDVASYPEDKTLVCRYVQNYVARCQQAGISISSWRNATFCPMTCPVKSHYELCADTCSSTCASLTESSSCSECLEGCQCDEGFVSDGGTCKLVDDCGCLVEGRYYKSGESVVRGDCIETCTCKAGQFSCQSMKCKEEEVCRKKDGVPTCMRDPCSITKCREKERCVERNSVAVCVASSKASCRVVGDPNYETFDGSRFSFQGTCSYVMVKTSGADKSLTEFTIINKNELAHSTRGSFIKTVTIKFPGHEIIINQRAHGKVKIDGKESLLPVSLDSDRTRITQSGIRGILETDFGLEVTFDWGEFFKVTVSSSYYKNLVGMCGTYNDNPNDDFVTPSGVPVKNNTELGQSWSVSSSDPKCWHFPPCSEEEKRQYSGPKFCGLLEDEAGPFASCNNTIKLEHFTYSCLFYTCLTHGNRDNFCNIMTTFSNTCKWSNTEVPQWWRQITNCKLDK
ncbi:IgGFc-binding protein isoform X1 [Pangasianodon hypophthalmus]|uniref:IgGFc-binding protein isoform X1 n=1 Tax=Pangasianodon hypophthalmus TaxID=310915 RepID=UPI000F00336C|nr:IgGFc-binding protein isoform X1 [Pangasianodon hypophthalmus]